MKGYGATKRNFSTAAALRRFTPAVLAEFLLRYPEYLNRKKLAIPAPEAAAAKTMPYDAIRDACMAADIDPELNRVLFMATQLGTEEGWRRIQQEMAARDLKPQFDPTPLTHHDLPLMTWLRRKLPEQEDILEQSYARVRMHAKSSYRYYAALRDVRRKLASLTVARKKELQSELAYHFTGDANNDGVKLFDYDHEEEIWFFVRYPGQPVRPDAIDRDGAEADVFYIPCQYDAIVYHKTYGDLRLNTTRPQDHRAYRIAFGRALLGESNVFDPQKRIITLAPLMRECVHLFAGSEHRGYPHVLPIEIQFNDSIVPGRKITWRADEDDGNLLQYPTGSNPRRLLPETVDTVHHAKFKYRLTAVGGWHAMTVHQGMDLRFERDGDSLVLEKWLRAQGFIIDVFKKS